jgi:CBS domain-containing protein
MAAKQGGTTGAKVRDVMTQDPIALDANATVVEAAEQMRDAAVGDVLVVQNGRLLGIVTDRDIAVRGVAAGEDPRTMKLANIMSAELTTVSPDDDAARAVELMRKRALRRLPVVENGRLVGILSLGDLAIEGDRRSAGSALGSISAAPPNN